MKTGNQKGQALVEVAIILPLLLLLVFGVIEFGRAMFTMNTLNHAARQGARQASVCNPFNVATIQTGVIASVPSVLQSGMAVSVTPTTPAHGTSTVTVTVTKPFTTYVPILIPGLSGITLTGQASMLYE